MTGCATFRHASNWDRARSSMLLITPTSLSLPHTVRPWPAKEPRPNDSPSVYQFLVHVCIISPQLKRIDELATCEFIFFSSFSLSVRRTLPLAQVVSLILDRHSFAFGLLVCTGQYSIGPLSLSPRLPYLTSGIPTRTKQGWWFFWRLWGHRVYYRQGLEGFGCLVLDESARSGTLSESFPACRVLSFLSRRLECFFQRACLCTETLE